MDWTPTLADREGPVYRHIVDALAADITNGRLTRGQQLPTQVHQEAEEGDERADTCTVGNNYRRIARWQERLASISQP